MEFVPEDGAIYRWELRQKTGHYIEQVCARKLCHVLIGIAQVKAMVQGKDRRPELGYKMALMCR